MTSLQHTETHDVNTTPGLHVEETKQESSSPNNHHTSASTNSNSSVMSIGGVTNGLDYGTTTHMTPEEASKDFSWWRIVVVLVVFCAMAGIIMWILKCIGKCQENRKGSESDSLEEEESFASNEKISTSRV